MAIALFPIFHVFENWTGPAGRTVWTVNRKLPRFGLITETGHLLKHYKTVEPNVNRMVGPNRNSACFGSKAKRCRFWRVRRKNQQVQLSTAGAVRRVPSPAVFLTAAASTPSPSFFIPGRRIFLLDNGFSG
ncbi:hypothetical protein PIB30_069473 [Stylosanthes scabra]|uniref:Uncharacterized protein n=1 Tax=Stylosanthes scabra TaxID=79078 RepID=A0ABU6VMU0_9FABA|nr:hypothetical protein [Stylosanthes scabra]